MRVLEGALGLLIPRRPAQRFMSKQGYGVPEASPDL